MEVTKHTIRVSTKRHCRVGDDNLTKEYDDSVDTIGGTEEEIKDKRNEIEAVQEANLRIWVDSIGGKPIPKLISKPSEKVKEKKVEEPASKADSAEEPTPSLPDIENKTLVLSLDSGEHICPLCWDGRKDYCEDPTPGSHKEVKQNQVDYCTKYKMAFALCKEHQDIFWKQVKDKLMKDTFKKYLKDLGRELMIKINDRSLQDYKFEIRSP